MNSAASGLECNDRGKSALIGKSLIFFWVKKMEDAPFILSWVCILTVNLVPSDQEWNPK